MDLLKGAWFFVAEDGGAATLIATVIAGIAGAILNRSADARRTANEREAHLLKGLELLSGGTQKRSAGIGLLEGLLGKADPRGDMRDVFVPVIRNQLIYLATTTDSREEVHEHDNFVRLWTLWRGLDPTELEKQPLALALPLRRTNAGLGLEFDPPYDAAFQELCRSVGVSVPAR